MNVKNCDSDNLRKYADGLLSTKECEAIEAHAVQCGTCASELDRLLSGAAKMVAEAAALQAVPAASLQRVTEQVKPRRRWVWLTLPPAAAVACVAMWAWLGAGQNLRLLQVEGLAFANGELVQSGDLIPTGATLALDEGATVELEQLRLRAIEGPTIVALQSGSRLEVRPLSGVATLETRKKGSYVAISGRDAFRPLGTTFMLEPRPSGATAGILHGQVEVHSGEGSLVLNEGQAWSTGRTQLVQEDPTATVGLPPIPQFEGLSVSIRRESADPELAEILKRASRRPKDPEPLVAMARYFLERQEGAACGRAIVRAFELDSSLAGMPSDRVEQAMLRLAIYPEDGDPEAAMALAGVLASRGGLTKDALQALSQWVDRRDEASRADQLIGLYPAMPSFYIGEVLLESRGADPERVLRAISHLKLALAGLPADATSRQRAFVIERLAEAQYYSLTQRSESIRNLRSAVDLWPRPHWLVHLGARISETGGSVDEAWKYLTLGFLADPSIASAERLLALMSNEERTPADLQQRYAVAEWLSKSFPTVFRAQALAGNQFDPRHPQLAVVYFDRALALKVGEPGPYDYWIPSAWARAEFARSAPSEDAERARVACEIAQRAGLLAEGKELQLANYYQGIRQHRLAIDAIRKMDIEPLAKASCLAVSLAEVGSMPEALEACEAYLVAAGSHPEPLTYTEISVLRAELLLRIQPDEARNVAKALIVSPPPGIKDAWRGKQGRWLGFEARLRWILGDRRRAIALQRKYLAHWPLNPDAAQETLRLNSWLHLDRPHSDGLQ